MPRPFSLWASGRRFVSTGGAPNRQGREAFSTSDPERPVITRRGATEWNNVHLTHHARLDDLISVDNSPDSGGPARRGFEVLRETAREVESIIADARRWGRPMRGLGSGWALTDIAVTEGWLLDTKLLNGCFDVSSRYFCRSYPEELRPLLVITQCGTAMGELNVFLEVARHPGARRALKTAGIGAGQTVAGAVSGNTHGAAIKFGSTPEFVAGIQLVVGTGRSLWIERQSRPVLNRDFADMLGARVVRDDDVFNSALVSFGAFGVITALAIETDPIYHLKFDPVREVSQFALKTRLGKPIDDDHFEFIFNPYDSAEAMVAAARRVPWKADHPAPAPLWIIRSKSGFAPGDRTAVGFLKTPFLSARAKAKLQFKLYRENAILDDVRGSPGQLFTATITYFEGYTESAYGVSLDDAAKTLDVSSEVVRELKLPAISQVRLVKPTQATLGFTRHEPATAVFEFGLVNNQKFAEFEKRLRASLRKAGVEYTFHWSKNSCLDEPTVCEMYGKKRIDTWLKAREWVFEGDKELMRLFDNDHVRRAGLGVR
ncbi:MAG TPA: FAD-binding protein [Thermoanaerobaculia bacterium]|nr:FAD-binding protein [Thermoanaerobaculia bacterium]